MKEIGKSILIILCVFALYYVALGLMGLIILMGGHLTI